jgi:hypothetical protein
MMCYVLHSEGYPVYLAINNRPVYAGALSLGDQTHNSNEDGLLWSVIQDW